MFNLFRKKNNDVKKIEVQVSPEYIEWRKKILTFAPTGNLKGLPDEVYGLLMDVGMGDERGHFLAISIYAFNTGEASLRSIVWSRNRRAGKFRKCFRYAGKDYRIRTVLN